MKLLAVKPFQNTIYLEPVYGTDQIIAIVKVRIGTAGITHAAGDYIAIKRGRALWFNLFVCLYVCLFVCLLVCLFVCLLACVLVCLFCLLLSLLCLFASFVCLFVLFCLFCFVCLFVRLFVQKRVFGLLFVGEERVVSFTRSLSAPICVLYTP